MDKKGWTETVVLSETGSRHWRMEESRKRERDERRFLEREAQRPRRQVITDPVVIELMFLEHINVD